MPVGVGRSLWVVAHHGRSPQPQGSLFTLSTPGALGSPGTNFGPHLLRPTADRAQKKTPPRNSRREPDTTASNSTSFMSAAGFLHFASEKSTMLSLWRGHWQGGAVTGRVGNSVKSPSPNLVPTPWWPTNQTDLLRAWSPRPFSRHPPRALARHAISGRHFRRGIDGQPTQDTHKCLLILGNRGRRLGQSSL